MRKIEIRRVELIKKNRKNRKIQYTEKKRKTKGRKEKKKERKKCIKNEVNAGRVKDDNK